MSGHPWINPIGGLGDMLLLSGVLKQVIEADPTRRFNVLRRTGYGAFLDDHPAVETIGYAPKGVPLQRVDYWSMEKLGPDGQRPYQVLARGFGLETPVGERLWIPGGVPDDPFLDDLLPTDRPVAVIAPSSESPRKVPRPEIWHRVADLLLADGVHVVQMGNLKDQHIRNTYSLRGMTTPHQAIALVRRCDLLLAVDSFAAHAAHMVGTPAVVLWGATHHEIYGWPGHTHFQLPKACELDPDDDCIGPVRNEGGRLYSTPCPHGDDHCLDRADPQKIYRAVRSLLGY